MPPGDLAVIIPAKNEADRIAATVCAAGKLTGADIIVVVDDGSTDDTAALRPQPGARSSGIRATAARPRPWRPARRRSG